MENVVSDCPCDWKKQGQLTKAEQRVLAFFFQRDIKKAWQEEGSLSPGWLSPGKVRYPSQQGEGLLGARKTFISWCRGIGGVTVEGNVYDKVVAVLEPGRLKGVTSM